MREDAPLVLPRLRNRIKFVRGVFNRVVQCLHEDAEDTSSHSDHDQVDDDDNQGNDHAGDSDEPGVASGVRFAAESGRSVTTQQSSVRVPRSVVLLPTLLSFIQPFVRECATGTVRPPWLVRGFVCATRRR